MEYILRLHSIEVKTENGRLYAGEAFTMNGVPGFNWIDVTDWSRTELMHWLGY